MVLSKAKAINPPINTPVDRTTNRTRSSSPIPVIQEKIFYKIYIQKWI